MPRLTDHPRTFPFSTPTVIEVAGRAQLITPGSDVVLAAGKEFRKLAENPLEERTLASYAVTHGALFIRSEEHLFRIVARP